MVNGAVDSSSEFCYKVRMDNFLKDLWERKRSLKRQLEQFNAAERAYRAAAKVVPKRMKTQKKVRKLKKMTIKQSVIQILMAHPHGLTARQILEKLRETSRPELPRHVLSPQLSRLLQEGRLTHKGRVWSLPQSDLLELGGDGDAIV